MSPTSSPAPRTRTCLRAKAKRCILDCLGVTIPGALSPAGGIVSQYLKDVQSSPRCTVIGLGQKTSPTNAAFANGLLGHALDYDDMHYPMIGHPTVVVLPAVLAAGEMAGADGRQLLASFAVGFEVACKMGAALNPDHWYKGFHATGTLGTLAAAAGAANMLGLTPEQTVYALGTAGSQAAGLKENFGTMTKPLHAGHAVECGLRAALLARRGFTATERIFEGPLGFSAVMVQDYDLDKLTDHLGDPWALVDPGAMLKAYPSCGGTHPMLNAVLELVQEQDIRAEDVESAEAGTSMIGPQQLFYTMPTTALEGKFSAQFCLAIAMLERRAGLAQFTDEKVREPRIRDLMSRITLVVDPEVNERLRPEVGDDEQVVRVRLKDGRELEKWASLRDIPDDTLMDKYRECTAPLMSQEAIDRSIDEVMNLERVEDLSKFLGMYSP